VHGPGPRVTGGVLCAAGFALIVAPAPLAAALGLELLALAFWWWARAAREAAVQVPRWSWLRRPAAALWLAAAIAAALMGGGYVRPSALAFWRTAEAAAIVWAALELLAALPLARPFSDLPGPLSDRGFWLPALLPCAGFLILWRQASGWLEIDRVRGVATALLLITAALAALRAFGRRHWTAGLRWLVVWDGAMAGALLASRALPPAAVALLWIGAGGTHTYLLAAELEGATPRRGATMATLWRATAWTASAALTWPLLVSASGLPFGRAAIVLAVGGLAVALASWVNVARMAEAPERRSLARPGPGLTLSRIAPALLLSGVPVAIVGAWWTGFAARWEVMLGALAPAAIGGGAALLTFRMRGAAEAAPAPAGEEPGSGERAGRVARHVARLLFRLAVGFERALVRAVTALLRAITTPLRDLHTGDAQEYVLFLVGVAVLAALLPLLR